jgi:hypothetical protein
MPQENSPSRVYGMLLDRARRVGWPRYFVNDLYLHDMTYLYDHKPPVFAWVLRESGTHMLDPRWLPGSEPDIFGRPNWKVGAAEWAEGVALVEIHALWYWYDGRYLTATTSTVAIQRLRLEQARIRCNLAEEKSYASVTA